MTVIQLKSLNKIVLDLKQYFLLENETNINNLSPLGYSRKKTKNFFTLPWKFHTKQSSIPGYSAKLCQLYFLEILRLKSKIPGNSTLFFLGHSWKPHVISLLPLKIPYLHHPPPCSFFFLEQPTVVMRMSPNTCFSKQATLISYIFQATLICIFRFFLVCLLDICLISQISCFSYMIINFLFCVPPLFI